MTVVMREVSKDEFWRWIGQMNVHPSPVGQYPYTSIFRTPYGTEVARIKSGETGEASRYFVCSSENFPTAF